MAESDPTERAYLQARIDATEASILAFEAAIDALAAGNQTYMLDTGQTRLSVTKANLGSMRIQLDSLLNRRQVLRELLDGGPLVGTGAF